MPKQCNVCGELRCTCASWQQKATEWVVKYCANFPHCDVRIRERITSMGDPVCKWCREIERGEREPLPSMKELLEKVKA